MEQAPLAAPFDGCPICEHPQASPCITADCTHHPLFHQPLPNRLEWLQCERCGHVFTSTYWTAAGLTELFRLSNAGQVANRQTIDNGRPLWADTVHRVAALTPHPEALFSGEYTWIDVGCGAGSLLMTAAEFGFNTIGLDLREQAVAAIQRYGFKAVQGDILDLELDQLATVVSMADVLEHMPFPAKALRAAHRLLNSGGLLLISCPNIECASWIALDQENQNPYWAEIEHHHNFSRRLLAEMLRQTGFRPLQYHINRRYLAGMEIIAQRL